MAQPFYMEYETRCNGMHGCIDSYKQFMNIQKHEGCQDRPVLPRLRREPRDVLGEPETGCSANFWLRAMGWFLVAMVDTLERMDNQLYYEYRAIMANAEGRGGRDDRLPGCRERHVLAGRR